MWPYSSRKATWGSSYTTLKVFQALGDLGKLSQKNTPFFYKQSIFDPRPECCLSFSKKSPQKLFSNCLVDGLLTSIVEIFKRSKRLHGLLQGHLEYVIHTFELTSPKVSISLRFPMQKKGFSLFLQWIV